MIIKIKNYTDGIHHFEFEEPAEKIGLGDPFYNGVKLNVKMDKSNSQLVFDCNLHTKAKLDCDRCLNEYDAEFETDFIITYIIGTDNGEEVDNLYYLSPEDDKINLTQDAYDYAKLSMPMKSLCSDDCKGLCPKCGKDLNVESCDCKENEINPIWEALLSKKKKEDDTKD